MVEVHNHQIITIKKTKRGKTHIKYLRDGVGKTICGNFPNHTNFIVDELDEGECWLQAILEDKNICSRCLKPIEQNMKIYGKGLTHALRIVYVTQSWNHKSTDR